MTTIVLEKAQKIEREVFKGLNTLISIKVYNSGDLPYIIGKTKCSKSQNEKYIF